MGTPGPAFLPQLPIQGVAGVAPDLLVRVALLHPPQKWQQHRLVGRLEWFAPQQGQALHIGGRQGIQDLVLLRPGKGLAVAEVPGLLIEAAGAVVGAAGDEQGHPYSGSVGHVRPLDGRVIHKNSSLLQVEHPGLDLLGLANIPEVLTQVTAGAAGDVHLAVVLVAAAGALPLVLVVDLDLPVIAAHLAVVALGVELGVLDVVVDVAHHILQGLQVVAHIGHLHVGDGATGGDLLELALKGELGEGVHVLPHIHMVGVGVVALVSDILNGAVLLLVDAGEAVAQALGGGAVEGEAQSGLLLPPVGGLPQVAHHPQGKLLSLGGGVGAALDQLGQLVQADVAQRQGGVAALQQLVDGLALFQPGDGAVLPVNGGDVGAHSLQGVVAAHQGLEAQLQTAVQLLPELVLVPSGDNAHLGQVDGHHALVEAALKLVVAILILPGGEEGAASHGREHVALIVLPHLLGGDVVGVHPLGGALHRQMGQVVILAALEAVALVQHIHQLGEGGGDVHALLVLDALQTLGEDLLDDGGVLLHVGVVLPQHQEEGDKGGLAVGGHQGVDLVLNGLHTALQLVLGAGLGDLFHGLVVQLRGGLPGAAQILVVGQAQVLAQVAHLHRLAAVLVGGHTGNDLGKNCAGHLEALWRLDELTIDHSAFVQHISNIN